ncbi:XTP/dITP diphosphohydrolase [Lishizhenia tianjinensis]|uniref:dITP/XTP pyrophosphatase n=1 Tax=Lishizhenia tianjinensis TaxID=477690 RepID=A0A1I7A161_9FLAO|nr:non-canonical purine NTP diphosphatase [Lishizhenia tianjinensis]SFT68627.1 XTP/dITP diphosphohydrolase [Lishizhenia tianjinensis]
MELIFSTQNQNKANEIQKLVPEGITIKTLKDINCADDIPETQDTLQGNALQKARYVHEKFGVNCFADDTGLEIEALNMEPGVYSARYAGPERSDDNNMQKVLDLLADKSNRNARFRTAVALIINGEEHLFEGIVNGEIRTAKSGDQGFGYDPIFEPENAGKTFAEMSTEEKNSMSHRARAFAKMTDFLAKYQSK